MHARGGGVTGGAAQATAEEAWRRSNWATHSTRSPRPPSFTDRKLRSSTNMLARLPVPPGSWHQPHSRTTEIDDDDIYLNYYVLQLSLVCTLQLYIVPVEF